MKVLVTGADGFIGKNLLVALKELGKNEVLAIRRETTSDQLASAITQADFVIHLAGVNRPVDPADFSTGNGEFTLQLCDALRASNRAVPVAFASSIQAEYDTPYGQSKLLAEGHLRNYANDCSAGVVLFRLANVFGKWCRPNYNSVVATFCHNLTRGLPIRIDDPTVALRLTYIDDVVSELIRFLDAPPQSLLFVKVEPEYKMTVGELADQIMAFRRARESLVSEQVGLGLIRALYSTYVSNLPPDAFSYKVASHTDSRGTFVEMLKTKSSGQFSFFTAHPGVTRGGHYHHTKSEKFLVVKGNARFKFRHIVTNETYTIETEGSAPVIVESIPGWAHDISNVGTATMIVMLWANEIFDRKLPDTFTSNV